jgi:hypothetical protein
VKKNFIVIISIIFLLVSMGCINPVNDTSVPAPSRTTIAELSWMDSNLYSAISGSGFTYADQVTTLLVSSVPVTSLLGIENLTNLQTLTLFDTGINTVTEVDPLLIMTSLTSLNLWETPEVGNDIKIVLTNALTCCTFTWS